MATLTKGKTFTSGETVTPTKLHELVDLGTVTGIVDADISASAAIAGSKLADSAVATAKIADSAVTPEKLSRPYTLLASQNSTSGTSIDFTGIPSWAKRIVVMFRGVSVSGTSNIAIRLGTSGGFVASGYSGVGSNLASSPSFGNNDTGFRVSAVNANTSVWHGNATLAKLADNIWTISGALGRSDAEAIGLFAGSIDAGGVVDRLRVTTLAGTDTFDAGAISVSYEG